ncbi:hypothetical protein Nepgr_022915 [Nepenthes gracilis]|uniref:Uncharacterized protein n=1 Tax=Nepenthes gracilis TaxID=150966 RepID=A0AAD3XXF5_NEPGR|nr:hypothetical protein Nepgr_022915 [Nepenthes gracilis]
MNISWFLVVELLCKITNRCWYGAVPNLGCRCCFWMTWMLDHIGVWVTRRLTPGLLLLLLCKTAVPVLYGIELEDVSLLDVGLLCAAPDRIMVLFGLFSILRTVIAGSHCKWYCWLSGAGVGNWVVFFVAGWPIVVVFIKLPIVFWAGLGCCGRSHLTPMADLICRLRPFSLVILPISVGVSASCADLICSRHVMLMLLLMWTQHWRKCSCFCRSQLG